MRCVCIVQCALIITFFVCNSFSRKRKFLFCFILLVCFLNRVRYIYSQNINKWRHYKYRIVVKQKWDLITIIFNSIAFCVFPQKMSTMSGSFPSISLCSMCLCMIFALNENIMYVMFVLLLQAKFKNIRIFK